MLSKNQIKLITSLRQKKYRNLHGLFVAEGIKLVDEFLQSRFKLHSLYCTHEYSENTSFSHTLITEKELTQISNLKNPNKVLGVFEIPKSKKIIDTGLVLALDGINDPGNLGTIIRLCDWFGVKQLVCSDNTVDCYNPKVVQASMGSLSRVTILYTNLSDFLKNTSIPIYGAFMDGKNIYQEVLEDDAIIVMGNEANGISGNIEILISKKINIPHFNDSIITESLNVATATAIILNEFRRPIQK